MKRAAALLVLAGAGCSPQPTAGLPGAAHWLLARQEPDGRFPAPAYGVLRAGHSTTALAAYALARAAPAVPEAAPAARRALAFLRARGLVPAEGVDYPCYTAAYALLAGAALGSEPLADAVALLRARQLGAHRGWQEDDPEYGGFGFGVATGDKPEEGDVAGLGLTSLAVRALRAAGVPADDPALIAARVFVERCQVLDDADPGRHGGFVHHPRPGPLQSKAVSHDGRVQPYASATCDGWLALHALGLADSPRGRAAAAWLFRHAEPPRIGGFAHADERHRAYEEGLRMYALAALGEAMRSLPEVDPRWQDAVVAAVRARQQPDGSCTGWSPLMKEDEPAVATPLAVIALAGARER